MISLLVYQTPRNASRSASRTLSKHLHHETLLCVRYPVFLLAAKERCCPPVPFLLPSAFPVFCRQVSWLSARTGKYTGVAKPHEKTAQGLLEATSRFPLGLCRGRNVIGSEGRRRIARFRRSIVRSLPIQASLPGTGYADVRAGPMTPPTSKRKGAGNCLDHSPPISLRRQRIGETTSGPSTGTSGTSSRPSGPTCAEPHY